MIVVDSIVPGASTATVHATVWRGEYEHLETFELAKSPITLRDGTAFWNVGRLTVFGLAIVERLPRGQ